MNYLTDLANDEEIDSYDQSLQDFFAQRMDTDRFTATRLQMGIYGQRQEGVNMVRVKIPGGRLIPMQLNAIADVLENYVPHGEAHITTRQDIQLHYVPLADTPAVMRHLAKGGLTTREACGNTIRNVTACPLTGICSREHTDISAHLNGVVKHFLRKPLNQLMPRKFKISFSGCESDCAQGMIHDLGVIAIRQGTRFGFKVLVGGGLGHKPREGIEVESFIEEKDLLLVIEAVLTLHNKYSDRSKRAKSRIKFLVDKFGADGFIEKYREELARVKEVLVEQDYPKGEWTGGMEESEVPGPGAPRALFAQKQAGLYVVPVSVRLGQLTSIQMRGIASILKQYDLPEVRATQDQNLILVDVPRKNIVEIRSALANLGLGLPQAGDNVVACPGTSTCRLGITSSPTVGGKLSGGSDDLRIRVSGCHNGCAQPESGDIGIYGEGKRMFGKLVPHYQMYFGGNGMVNGGLAFKGPSVPSARIELAVERVKSAYAADREMEETFFNWTRRVGQSYFAELLADVVEVKQEDLQSVLRDHGQRDDFRVLQLGGGECAGAKQQQIGTAFFDAANERNYRNALKFQRKFKESAKCAEEIVRLISQGLTQLVGGQKYESLIEQAEELQRVLPTQPNLSQQLAKLAREFAHSANELTDALLTEWYAELDVWTLDVAKFCTQFDSQLDLTGSLPQAIDKPLQFQKISQSAVV
ncbi:MULTISPECIES: nitrite/sulfite reductase [Nitrosomonas]|uniref:Nitrite reductase n=1 Tax=Nitrosomonas communis TaxID=44574 RepID=A0A0F7KC46_9PROT|nr:MULTISPECIES: nitrite/sulfite reductase [Nitrosomonas]AKH36713.1 nitrite reductase [Nitrosomonas communis]TYP82863.1 sulfite reductase (NADPH) hemoprotein beta-component [Nitrosomonas communis]UVS61765.1 nitrite/sulfite reductase [Nitrosomonas sp. PLL12]